MTNLKALFGNRYKVRDDGTDDPCRAERVWCMEIPGKYGTIYSYGWDGSLAVWTASARMIPKLEALGLKRLQSGAECSYKFPLSMFEQIAELVKSRRRRQLSPEQRAKQAAILALARSRLAVSKPVSPCQEGTLAA